MNTDDIVGTATFKDSGGVTISTENKKLQDVVDDLSKREMFLGWSNSGNRWVTMSTVIPQELDANITHKGFYLQGGLFNVR